MIMNPQLLVSLELVRVSGVSAVSATPTIHYKLFTRSSNSNFPECTCWRNCIRFAVSSVDNDFRYGDIEKNRTLEFGCRFLE